MLEEAWGVRREHLVTPDGACIVLLVLVPAQCLSDASVEGQTKQEPALVVPLLLAHALGLAAGSCILWLWSMLYSHPGLA